MNGFYFHPRAVFELYIKSPALLAVCEVVLFNARYNTAVVNGITVKSGQCLMTLDDIAEISGVSLSQVRTAIKRFVADGGIRTENMGRKGILITLLPAFSCEGERVKAKEKKESYTYGKNTWQKPKITPDPNASYDLARAEARAKAKVRNSKSVKDSERNHKLLSLPHI